MTDVWTVYMHTCPNNKRYIGITSKCPEKRWLNGLGYKKQLFYKAICKYGWDNIKHEILSVVNTVEEAVKLEEEYIALYHTTDRDYGYNVSYSAVACGGIPKSKHSEETKKKMSVSAKLRKRTMTDKWRLSLERNRKKIKNVRPQISDDGKKRSIDSKAKAVVQYDENMGALALWESAALVRKIINVNPYPSLADYKRKCGGCYWRYAHTLNQSDTIYIIFSDLPVYMYSQNKKTV